MKKEIYFTLQIIKTSIYKQRALLQCPRLTISCAQWISKLDQNKAKSKEKRRGKSNNEHTQKVEKDV